MSKKGKRGRDVHATGLLAAFVSPGAVRRAGTPVLLQVEERGGGAVEEWVLGVLV